MLWYCFRLSESVNCASALRWHPDSSSYDYWEMPKLRCSRAFATDGLAAGESAGLSQQVMGRFMLRLRDETPAAPAYGQRA